MSKNYTIENIDGITVTRIGKSPSVQDFIDAYKEVAKFHKSALRMWDLSQGAHMTNSELKLLGEIGRELFTEPARVAVFAPKDLTFGLSKIHEKHRADDEYVTRSFRDEEEALEWLKLEG